MQLFNQSSSQQISKTGHRCVMLICVLFVGTCYEAWNDYKCECPSQWGGKDCTQGKETIIIYTSGLGDDNLGKYDGIVYITHGKRKKLCYGPVYNAVLPSGVSKSAHPKPKL